MVVLGKVNLGRKLFQERVSGTGIHFCPWIRERESDSGTAFAFSAQMKNEANLEELKEALREMINNPYDKEIVVSVLKGIMEKQDANRDVYLSPWCGWARN